MKPECLLTSAAGFCGLVLAILLMPGYIAAAVAQDQSDRGPAARSQTWQYIDQRAREAQEARVRVLAIQPERKITPVAPPEMVIKQVPQATFLPGDLFADVFFASNSSEIGARDQERLRRQAEWLREHPEAKLTVAGYCDDRGNRNYNLTLGKKRAEAVKNQLVRSGVDDRRITVRSYGNQRLFDGRRTAAARAANRRAQFVLAPQGPAVERKNGRETK